MKVHNNVVTVEQSRIWKFNHDVAMVNADGVSICVSELAIVMIVNDEINKEIF